jgi:hypothetical protein
VALRVDLTVVEEGDRITVVGVAAMIEVRAIDHSEYLTSRLNVFF